MNRRTFLQHGWLGVSRVVMQSPYTQTTTLIASDVSTPPLTLAAIQQTFDRLALAGIYKVPEPPDYWRRVPPSLISDCKS